VLRIALYAEKAYDRARRSSNARSTLAIGSASFATTPPKMEIIATTAAHLDAPRTDINWAYA